MPRNPKRSHGTRPYRNYTEESLNKALQAVRNKTLSIRNASSKYGIPKNTLHLKCQEKHLNAVGRAPVFTNEEELQFVGHIVSVSIYGFPVDVFELRCIVKSYLDRVGERSCDLKTTCQELIGQRGS